MFHAQTTVAVDLLGELDIPGLESLQLFLKENTDREYVHFSESDSVTVKDFYVRRLMNRVNSLPKGHEYNPWSESLHIAHDVSHMRQIFAPTMAFEHATILRGTFEPLKVRYRQTAGVLFYGVRRIQLSCISNHILLTTCRSWWSPIGAVSFSGTLMVVPHPNLFTHLSHLTLLVHHLHHLLVWILTRI